jgi:uncharacterized coiled-coil protein SlyX
MALKREGENMPSIDERVAYLEGRIEDHTTAFAELRADLREIRVEIRELRSEMRALHEQVSRQFTWMVGIQMTVLVAILAAFLRH